MFDINKTLKSEKKQDLLSSSHLFFYLLFIKLLQSALQSCATYDTNYFIDTPPWKNGEIQLE